MKGRVEIQRFHCPSLEGNPRGDPVERNLAVYVPPGYDRRRTVGYPAVYFLHGFLGTGLQWLNPVPFGQTVPEAMDSLIDEERVPPALGVYVDGFTSIGGSQWINSAGIGRYFDYLVNDVVRYVDTNFNTLAQFSSRIVVGKSSGGYGALAIAATQDATFGHVGSHSGDAGFEYCYLPDLPRASTSLLRAGGIDAWYQAFRTRAMATGMRGDDNLVLNALAMSAAYSPVPGKPQHLDYPLDFATGELKTEVWERWRGADPVHFVPRHLGKFSALKSLYIDCGIYDEFNLRWGARMVAAELKRGDVAHLHEEFEDGHRNVNYRFVRSLSWMLPRVAVQ